MKIPLTIRFINLLVLAFIFSSCHVSYVAFRPEQIITHNDSSSVIRVYIDRYGDFYPSPDVPIVQKDFNVYGWRSSSTLASLKYYFLTDSTRLKSLCSYYGVRRDSLPGAAFREVQRRILKNYVDYIKQTINMQQADKLIYLVHGFNDIVADTEFMQMRDTILKKKYNSAKRPVFVFIHWDGLNAKDTDGTAVVKVWKPALLDSRYASISLRKLLIGLEQETQTPAVIITHSLGAGVALGALFNTTSKWGFFNLLTSNADKERLAALQHTPTPVAPIRIGVLAPAIPGKRTFVDFNQRVPKPFESSQNHIEKVVIGYNYNDYGVTKKNKFFFNINLSRLYGSTSLGCNDTEFRKTEIELIMEKLQRLKYPEPGKIIIPMEFHTPFRFDYQTNQKLETCEHAWPFYITSKKMSDFLDSLFL